MENENFQKEKNRTEKPYSNGIMNQRELSVRASGNEATQIEMQGKR